MIGVTPDRKAAAPDAHCGAEVALSVRTGAMISGSGFTRQLSTGCRNMGRPGHPGIKKAPGFPGAFRLGSGRDRSEVALDAQAGRQSVVFALDQDAVATERLPKQSTAMTGLDAAAALA